MERDLEINAYYKSKGWTVLRFWDFEVKGELGTILNRVLAHFDEYSQ
jgi:DNA mismatch endonuclease, patch repair protein